MITLDPGVFNIVAVTFHYLMPSIYLQFKSYKYTHPSDIRKNNTTPFAYTAPFLECFFVGSKTPSKCYKFYDLNEQTTFHCDVGDNTHMIVRNYCETCNSSHEKCTHTMGTGLVHLDELQNKSNTVQLYDYCAENNDNIAQVVFENPSSQKCAKSVSSETIRRF